MASISQHLRASLLLAPVAIVIYVLIRMNIHRLSASSNAALVPARLLLGYRIGSYLCVVIFLAGSWFWVASIVAMNFNWSPTDAAEIEVRCYTSPDVRLVPRKTVLITAQAQISRLLASLGELGPYSSNHEHAIGEAFSLRMGRRSDGEWSKYTLNVYPNRAAQGGVVMQGVYVVEICYAGMRCGNYQATEFGRALDELLKVDG